MRKIFATLALTLCLTAMVSCDGDKKADNSTKRTEQNRTEQNRRIKCHN